MFVVKYLLTKIINTESLRKIINRIIPSKDKTIQCYSKASDLIANEFNNFFVSIGAKTANAAAKIGLDNNFDLPISSFLPGSPPECALQEMFQLSPDSCTDIKRIINSMPSNRAPGSDKVTMSVLKDCLPVEV